MTFFCLHPHLLNQIGLYSYKIYRYLIDNKKESSLVVMSLQNRINEIINSIETCETMADAYDVREEDKKFYRKKELALYRLLAELEARQNLEFAKKKQTK